MCTKRIAIILMRHGILLMQNMGKGSWCFPYRKYDEKSCYWFLIRNISLAYKSPQFLRTKSTILLYKVHVKNLQVQCLQSSQFLCTKSTILLYKFMCKTVKYCVQKSFLCTKTNFFVNKIIFLRVQKSNEPFLSELWTFHCFEQ